jgi:transketolase
VVAAGITVHEALKAHAFLAKEGIVIRVVDAYSIEPLDEAGLRQAAAECGGRVVVVEDHYPAGGLGEAVTAALTGAARVVHLCVRELPRSGKPDELIELYGIGAKSIIAAVKGLLG